MKNPSALAWKDRNPTVATTPLRGALERLIAIGYGLGYDAIVGGFAPWEELLDEVVAYVGRVGRPPHTVKVLDIACGTGTVAARLGRAGYHVVALDTVEHLVAVARRRHGAMANVSFHHRDVSRDQVPDAGTFDVVLSMHTLYWHPNPPGVLEACRRAVHAGGHGLFLTYARPARVGRTFHQIRTEQGIRAAVRALRWLLPTAAFETFRHYEPQYLSRGDLRASLVSAGFDVLEMRETFLAALSLLAWTRAGRSRGA
ncbi:MAG TPA: class I SAM-dependent methyltransferase [Methylomirabilota bacterium]